MCVCDSLGYKWKEGHAPLQQQLRDSSATIAASDVRIAPAEEVVAVGSSGSTSSSSTTLTTVVDSLDTASKHKARRSDKPLLLTRLRNKGSRAKAKAVVTKRGACITAVRVLPLLVYIIFLTFTCLLRTVFKAGIIRHAIGFAFSVYNRGYH